MSLDLFQGFVPIDDRARDGELQLLARPSSGDFLKAFWTNGMWAYAGPGAVVQTDVEPTHFKPNGLQKRSLP